MLFLDTKQIEKRQTLLQTLLASEDLSIEMWSRDGSAPHFMI